MVYCTVYPQSAEAFFAAAERVDARMIAGKAMLDRNAPKALLDTAQTGYDDSKALIERWRGRGRLDYAVTPRFAITSTPAQLEAAGALLKEFPGVYMQSHVDENKDEIEFARQLFPEARDYLDVYGRAGLLGPRSVFGHCIHMTGDEVAAMAETRVGRRLLPDLEPVPRLGPVRPGAARGAPASGSGSRPTSAAAPAIRCCGRRPRATRSCSSAASPGRRPRRFYQMTLGNARALSLDHAIGSIAVGKDADLVVLDSRATPAMAHRMETIEGDLDEELFVLVTLGDDRAVTADLRGRRAAQGLSLQGFAPPGSDRRHKAGRISARRGGSWATPDTSFWLGEASSWPGSQKRQLGQGGKRFRPCSFHQGGAVDFNGPLADSEIQGDRLVRLSPEDSVHNFTLSWRKPGKPCGGRFLEFQHLRGIFRQFEGAVDARDQRSAGDRLFDKIEGACPDRLDRDRHIAVSRDHDCRKTMTVCIELLEQPQPAQSRQIRVDQQEHGRPRTIGRQKRLGACIGFHDAPIVFKHGLYRLANRTIIVDDDEFLNRADRRARSQNGSGQGRPRRAP